MADETDSLKIEKMRELCRKRPVIYSDLDHLKKGSTGFLHEQGYSNEEIAAAMELDVEEVRNNLKGTGFALDLQKISKFSEYLPVSIGDVISIRIPSFCQDDVPVAASVRVVQCILRGENCGLVVEVLEDVQTGYPMFGNRKKGEEAVILLDWCVR
ncbi:MAG: hypothetical protein JW705_02085 [Methanosarcinaceae archaeon]|nr:hypothetical protein [Methanosarcinaceae archaeon]